MASGIINIVKSERIAIFVVTDEILSNGGSIAQYKEIDSCESMIIKRFAEINVEAYRDIDHTLLNDQQLMFVAKFAPGQENRVKKAYESVWPWLCRKLGLKQGTIKYTKNER